MLIFKLDPLAPFLDTIPILCHIGQKANIKSTSSMLTLMASPPSNHFIASLQILPEFFTYFNSDESHHSTIPLELFYIIMLRMEICGFTSMYFTLFQPLTKVLLTFQRSSSYIFSSLQQESRILCFFWFQEHIIFGVRS